MDDDNNARIRALVCQRIEEVEDAMQSLEDLRKTLLHKTYEAKQSILKTFISERDQILTKEINLLVEVDKLLHNKDDVLVIQLNKLSQVLGCLRNCLQGPHPCGDCLEKFDDIDMLSADEVNQEFIAANEMLQDSARGSCRPMASQVMQHSVDEVKNKNREHLTEWLLQYHASPSSSIEIGGLLTAMKEESIDQWLCKEVKPAGAVNQRTFNRFDCVTNENNQEWLKSVDEEDAAASDVTSSVDSSCVVLSGSTSESGSSYAYVDRTWPKEAAHSTSPYEVSEWVARCASGELDEPTMFGRGRLASVCSNMSSVTTSSAPASEWIRSKPASGSSISGNDWLCTKSPSAWGPSVKSDGVEMENSLMSFSHDVSEKWRRKERQESAAGDWLRSSDMRKVAWLAASDLSSKFANMDTMDWLSGEEKHDEPEEKTASKPGKDWLLVKEQFNRISESGQEGWLANSFKADNRLMCN